MRDERIQWGKIAFYKCCGGVGRWAGAYTTIYRGEYYGFSLLGGVGRPLSFYQCAMMPAHIIAATWDICVLCSLHEECVCACWGHWILRKLLSTSTKYCCWVAQVGLFLVESIKLARSFLWLLGSCHVYLLTLRLWMSYMSMQYECNVSVMQYQVNSLLIIMSTLCQERRWRRKAFKKWKRLSSSRDWLPLCVIQLHLRHFQVEHEPDLLQMPAVLERLLTMLLENCLP